MATILKLKIRDRADSVRVPTQLIIEWMKLSEEDAKDRLFAFFSPLEDGDATIHDKAFLETTINWTPTVDTERGPVAKGLPLTEQVRWIKLAQKVNDIDEEKEGEISLSNKDINLIWDRWNDKAFKMNSLQPRVIDLLMEFQETTNRWFPELEPEEEIPENPEVETEEVKGLENERESEREGIPTEG